MDEVILSALDERRVRTLQLNRPDRANALDDALVGALGEALSAIEDEGRTRVLVITGNGRHFCGGFDFTGYETLSHEMLGDRLIAAEMALARVRYAPYLTVALVNGAAIGAGADLACACAYRIGLDTARFRFPGFRFGVALGTRHLMRVVGPERARRILLEDLALDAEQSLGAGLLTHRADSAQDAGAKIDAIVGRVAELDDWSLAAMLRVTAIDTRAQDSFDLTTSVRRPGLHQRLRDYRARMAGGAS